MSDKQTSLVIELQYEIINNKSSLPDLLRKGLLIARKLKLDDFENSFNVENIYKQLFSVDLFISSFKTIINQKKELFARNAKNLLIMRFSGLIIAAGETIKTSARNVPAIATNPICVQK